MRRIEVPHDRRNELAHVADGLDLVRAGPRDRHVPRRPFLQQELGGQDDWLGMEARAHRAVVDDVRDRDDHHALVVRHVRAHHRDRGAIREPGRGVVERLVEAVGAAGPGRRQAPEILHRRGRIDHRRQPRRIGRDDDVLAEPASQSDSRHAEARILVGHFQIARVVARLRHPPRHAALGAIADLPSHHEPGCLLEQASRRRRHDERRHQVLEHRSRPGHEHRVELHRCQRPAEPEPVRDGDVALGDRDEAREPGFRCQQVVPTRVEASVRDAVPDREQLPHRIEEKAEVHGADHRPGQFRASSVRRRTSVSGMSRSRAWLSTVAQSASAQTRTSVCALPGPRDQRSRGVQHRLSAGLQRRRAARPNPAESRGGSRTASATALEGVGQGPVAGRAPACVTGRRDGRLWTSSAVSSIPVSAARSRRGRSIISSHACASTMRCAGEIAAVDRRDVLRLERGQCLVSYQL